MARLVVAAVEPAGVERVQRRTLSGTFGCRLLLDRASLAHRTLGRVGRNDSEMEIRRILHLELSLVKSWTHSIERFPLWFVQMQVLLLGYRVVVVAVAVAVTAEQAAMLPRMMVKLVPVVAKSWEIL